LSGSVWVGGGRPRVACITWLGGLNGQLLIQHLLQNGGSHIHCELTNRPRPPTFA